MSQRLLILHARVLTPDGVAPGNVLVANGRIAALLPPDAPVPPAATLDAGGRLLAPGFIDLQLNGGFGLDFTADPATLWQVAAQLPRYGVTRFLPTIISSPPETIRHAQRVLAAGPPPNFTGATPLGLHLEGPFLNPAKKGAHNPAHLRPPDGALAADWSPQTGVRMVTLAPELPGALPLIRRLAARGVVVSAGHSMATAAKAVAAFDAGVRSGTHLFNAMPPLHHREPGLAGALLADGRAAVGLIADGVHVHPYGLRLAWAAARRRLTLVTDGMAALGLGNGRFRLGDGDVTVRDGRAVLADDTLAGSVCPLDAALRRLQHAAGAPLADVLDTVTGGPARLLGLDNVGRIVPGAAADLVLLSAQGEVRMTLTAGHVAYAAGG